MEGIDLASNAVQLVTAFINAMKDRGTRKRFNELLKMIEKDLKDMLADDLYYSRYDRLGHSKQYYVYDGHLLKCLNALRGMAGPVTLLRNFEIE